MTDLRNLEMPMAKGFSLTSGGVAYNLTLEFYPDMMEVYNYTKAGTTAELVISRWFRGMPAGDAIQIQTVTDNGATGNISGVLETTNGFTWAGVAAAFADQHTTITGITAANPPVVTAAAHGLANGDRVMITQVVGMTEVNNNEYVVANAATNTFELNDVYGNTIDGSGFTAYSSGGQVTGQDESAATTLVPETFIMTMGTAVMGNDGDVLYVNAVKYPGGMENLGDIG